MRANVARAVLSGLCLVALGCKGSASDQAPRKGPETPLHFEPYAGGAPPDDAVVSGVGGPFGIDPVLVCQGLFNRLIPGKLYASTCFVSFAGQEIPLDHYSVLRAGNAGYHWRLNDSDLKLDDAFKGGVGEWGHPAYVCTSSHLGSINSGRVSDDGQYCTFGFAGHECNATHFYVLIDGPSPAGAVAPAPQCPNGTAPLTCSLASGCCSLKGPPGRCIGGFPQPSCAFPDEPRECD